MSNVKRGAPDFTALLARPDLVRVGIVMAMEPPGTTTFWIEPDADPESALAQAPLLASVAATLFCFETDLTVAIASPWDQAPWLVTYVEELAHDIQNAGGFKQWQRWARQ